MAHGLSGRRSRYSDKSRKGATNTERTSANYNDVKVEKIDCTIYGNRVVLFDTSKGPITAKLDDSAIADGRVLVMKNQTKALNSVKVELPTGDLLTQLRAGDSQYWIYQDHQWILLIDQNIPTP